MSYKIKKLKENVKAHLIQTPKFKTNLISLFLTLPLSRENVTKNALIPAVLKSGTKNLDTQEKIKKWNKKFRHTRKNKYRIRKYVWC